MKGKKYFVIGLMLVLSLVVSACGGSNQGSSQPLASDKQADATATTDGKSPKVTFSMFAAVDPLIENIETNWFTKHLEDQQNINIKWVVSTYEGSKDRKQLLLASGDYPEVFLNGGFTQQEQMQYGTQGVFQPLNELIDQYAPNIKKALADIPYLKQGITTPNGKIYGIPQINECYHCSYGQKMWINKKWLDNLGLKIPTTTDEFYTVLKAFKENDPNGNKKKDEIPLSGAVNTWNANIDAFIMNSFIYNDNLTYFLMKDGKLDFAANKPEWKQGLEYMRKLYKEGLVDPAAFTQNIDGLTQLGNHPGDAILGAFSAGHLAMGVSTEKGQQRHKDYDVVPPLKGPNGVQLTNYSMGTVSNVEFVITNKATKEQAIAAIKMADYLYSPEGNLLAHDGPEVKNWVKAAPGDLNIWGEQAKYKRINSDNKIQNDQWEEIGPRLMTKEFRDSWTAAQDPLADDGSGYETRLQQATKKYEGFQPKEIYPSGIFIDPKYTEELGSLQTSIQKHVKESMVRFITGNLDLNKDWDTYVADFNKLKLSRYLQIYQDAYDNMKKQ